MKFLTNQREVHSGGKTRDAYEVEGGLNITLGKAADCQKSQKYSKFNNLKNLQKNLQISSTLTAMQYLVCVKK
jgi:hypothetical protein